MDAMGLARMMRDMRLASSDSQQVEVKEAVGGLPRTMVETISAFANGSGGVIVLGVSERLGFHPAEGFQAQPIADALAQACRQKLTPAIQPLIEVLMFEGSPVVVATIPELNPLDKPCYVTSRGAYNGSYVRVGDGDRRLTGYEIDRLMEERRQPRHDQRIVEDATKADLRDDLMAGILERQRASRPRIFASLDDDAALQALGVLRADEFGVLRPTLAGLLALGTFPQQYFPRLNVTFAFYPGRTKADARGVKYSDALTAVGPIADILADILDRVQRNMRVGGVLVDGYRRDLPEYPPDAVREAVVNAIMHRDYSPMAQGAQVQVNMFADRLEVLSPGGLYGGVTVDTLGESGVSATRNMTLSALLEITPFRDGYVAENRGTGFQLMTALTERNGNGRPEAKDSLSSFALTFHSNVRRLGTSQNISPASGRHLPEYGGEGSARIYRLPSQRPSPLDEIDDLAWPGGISAADLSRYSPAELALLHFIAEHEPVQAPDAAQALGLPRSTATYRLRKLLADGVIERTEPARSPKQAYRLRRTA